MINNYVTYHLHSDNSLLDSCTNFELYIEKAVQLKQTSICFTEHGNIYNWTIKKKKCEENGLKYLHGCEVYLTESLYNVPDIPDEVCEGMLGSSEQELLEFQQEWYENNAKKIRDNYHTVLIAKNLDGIKELNKLISISTDKDHFYYKPRISFEEFFNISDNVIKISACLASPLKRYKEMAKVNGTTNLEISENFEKLCKTYDYYEVQYHNCKEQIEYNKFLLNLSKEYDKPLIAGTDTHSLNKYKAECRSILQKSKGIEFSNEDEFDLTYKSYEELVKAFTTQNALPNDVILEAINNTNIMADSVEAYNLDLSIKYPHLYDNDEEVYIKRIYDMFQDKIDKGIIEPKDIDKFKSNIEEEIAVFKKVDMMGFMLSMSDICMWAKNNNRPLGFSRGSVGGSTVAYVTDITDINPVKWNLVFSRFCNEHRREVGD